MKISFDLDGTVLSHLAFFRNLMVSLQAAGHEVGILTARREIHKLSDAMMLQHYKFPTPNFWIHRSYRSKKGYAEFKVEAIIENDIDMHFDDCSFEDLAVEISMRDLLGKEAHRLIKVTPRYPMHQHYE